jgi:hypothetical protein
MTTVDDGPVGGPDEQMFLKYLSRHIVALCGSYIYLDDKGQPTGEPKFYSYTGIIFEILDHWVIVTAGHVLRSIEDASKHAKVRVKAEVLVDYCGAGAKNNQPIPFKPLEQGWTYVDDDSLGLDFGLIFIRPFFKASLQTNGIMPLTSGQWNFPSTVAFEQHAIVGFPDEYTGGHASSSVASMVGHVKPTYVPIRRLPDDTSKTFIRLKGEIIDKGDQESIKGMSGGPIFGFYKEGTDVKYLLEALQVEWDKNSIVYGCPIKTIMLVLKAKLQEDQKSQQGNASGT